MAAQASAIPVYGDNKTEDERINEFINELAEQEGYNITTTAGGKVNEHASLNEREAHATRKFKKDVRALLKKHGLVFA